MVPGGAAVNVHATSEDRSRSRPAAVGRTLLWMRPAVALGIGGAAPRCGCMSIPRPAPCRPRRPADPAGRGAPLKMARRGEPAIDPKLIQDAHRGEPGSTLALIADLVVGFRTVGCGRVERKLRPLRCPPGAWSARRPPRQGCSGGRCPCRGATAGLPFSRARTCGGRGAGTADGRGVGILRGSRAGTGSTGTSGPRCGPDRRPGPGCSAGTP